MEVVDGVVLIKNKIVKLIRFCFWMSNDIYYSKGGVNVVGLYQYEDREQDIEDTKGVKIFEIERIGDRLEIYVSVFLSKRKF